VRQELLSSIAIYIYILRVFDRAQEEQETGNDMKKGTSFKAVLYR
jgi:hypothetical protein